MEMALVPRRFPKYAAGLNIAGTPRAENTTGALPSNVARKRGGIVRAVSKSCHFAEWALLRFVKAGDFGFRLRDGVSQLAPQDFAGCSLRNGIHEMDGAWLFVSCEAVGDEGAELFS